MKPGIVSDDWQLLARLTCLVAVTHDRFDRQTCVYRYDRSVKAPDATPPPRRHQNLWGEGEQLRDDILAAARQLLEQNGTEAAISMRGVARVVGITAPSIYPHFPDRESLLTAVIDAIYHDFAAAQQDALERLPAGASPRDRMRAGLRAFIDFSREQPASTQVLWVRPHPSPAPATRRAAEATHAYTEQTLVALCPGLHGAELKRRGQILWAGVYGLAVLPPHHPRHDWCDPDQLVDELIDSVVRPPCGAPSATSDGGAND